MRLAPVWLLLVAVGIPAPAVASLSDDPVLPAAELRLAQAELDSIVAPADAAGADRERALNRLRRDERSGALGVWMSFPFPGWGQLYADSPFWSTVAFSAQMYFLGNIALEAHRAMRHSVRRDREDVGTTFREARDSYVTEHRERVRDYVWWSAAGYFLVALDAYVSVELAAFDDPDPPTPDLDREWDRGDEPGEGVALRLNFGF